MHPGFAEYLTKTTNSIACEEQEIIQTLWSDYGKISRYKLQGSKHKTVVVKHISSDMRNNHPRGWNTNLSHKRKLKSYEIETHWYRNWNSKCNDKCCTAQFLGSFTQKNEQWIILEDLDASFPARKQHLSLSEVKTCLRWLANFHGVFMNKKPIGLWDIGTYWHLDTRPEEFEKIEHQKLKQNAHQVDELLNRCTFQTIVHGDAKVANFCFTESGQNVAAVDFQYVGGGCGMKDVVYFLGSCLSSEQCESNNEELLHSYFSELKDSLRRNNSATDFGKLHKEWMNLFPVAWTDFTRFLAGWMPSHQKVNDYSLRLMESVLSDL